MVNLTKLEFITIDRSDKNSLHWTFDVDIHLTANNLRENKNENMTSQ
jgi:hypothetical protein